MKVRLALVGAGAMAEYHVKKFLAIPGVSIGACAGTQPEWMREWSVPSFREGPEVQKTLERLMDQARLHYGKKT